jgi:hypothetical protein
MQSTGQAFAHWSQAMQVVAVKAPIACGYGNRQFRILEVLGEGPPLLVVGAAENPQCDPHAFQHGPHRGKQVSKPLFHRSSGRRCGSSTFDAGEYRDAARTNKRRRNEGWKEGF